MEALAAIQLIDRIEAFTHRFLLNVIVSIYIYVIVVVVVHVPFSLALRLPIFLPCLFFNGLLLRKGLPPKWVVALEIHLALL